jgi:hypothetical protein
MIFSVKISINKVDSRTYRRYKKADSYNDFEELSTMEA